MKLFNYKIICIGFRVIILNVDIGHAGGANDEGEAAVSFYNFVPNKKLISLFPELLDFNMIMVDFKYDTFASYKISSNGKIIVGPTRNINQLVRGILYL